MSKAANPVWRWFQSTSNRTFVAYPLMLAAIELAIHRGAIAVNPWATPLLAWGYLQYKLVGIYRSRMGGGGPGLSVPPQRLVTEGPYRLVRNPMYLGHLIFLAGLALVLRSWIGAALFVAQVVWFQQRVVGDEARLAQLFGADYAAYAARVKRWIPGVV